MLKLFMLNVICGLLQMVGLLLYCKGWLPALLPVCGFAAVVRLFLPGSGNSFVDFLRIPAAIAGLVIMLAPRGGGVTDACP